MNNMAQVSELKKTDTKLRSKLSTVEQDINKLGAGIIFRSEFMKKFNYWNFFSTFKKSNYLMYNLK